AAQVLDQTLFDANPDNGVRPAGLLNGIAGLTPTAGGGQAAFEGDVKQLYGALAAKGAGLAPVIVCAAQQAGAIKVFAGPKFDIPVLPSAGLASGTVIMIEPSAFVSGFEPTPTFEVSAAALLHYEDTSPQDITGGTPSPAVPAKSLFQTDSLALR